jgi:hypothetical protein
MEAMKQYNPGGQLNAYIDQNFLIDCLNRQRWRTITAEACGYGRVRLVLSPWSIYEIGNAAPPHMEELLAIAVELNPSWILERVDLQLREFVIAWDGFWNGTITKFDPIRTLSEVNASFFRCSRESVEKYSIRDCASVWQHKEAAKEASVEFRRQESISAFNRAVFPGGKLSPAAIRDIRKRYVARQFAIAKRIGIPPHEIRQHEKLMLGEARFETFISFFVDFGGMDELLAHRVEEALTFDQWKTEARLNSNRQLDRFHAIAALPYCDLFVTSDRELAKKTRAIRADIKFKIAEVLSGEEFIERIKRHA